MTDINIQQLTNTQKVDDTNDIAGGASVSPSYIASDVPSVFDPSASIGIDNVAVSNGVSTSQVATGSAVEQDQSSNYIQSDVQSNNIVSDPDDMDSINKVEGAEQYIDPSASCIKQLLAQLKAEGIITSGMTDEQIVSAINNYVHTHFSYIADPSGTDHWNLVSQTIQDGGGDCEDLANLAASLSIAALMDKGLTLDEANKKISCVVVVDPNALVGHVIVQFTGNDGSVEYFDPTAGTRSNSIGSSKIELFSYNSEGVDLFDKNYDYSKFSTALITVPTTNIGLPEILNYSTYADALEGTYQCIQNITTDLELNDLITILGDYDLADIDVTVSGTDKNTGTNYTGTSDVTESAQWIQARIDGGCTVKYEDGDPITTSDSDHIFSTRESEYELAVSLGGDVPADITALNAANGFITSITEFDEADIEITVTTGTPVAGGERTTITRI